MTARTRKKPADAVEAPTRTGTRFKVTMTFQFEADGNCALPRWISERYRAFLIGGLQQQKLQVPVYLVPGSSCKAYVVHGERHARAAGAKFYFTGGEWSDRGETKTMRIFGDELTVFTADGEVEP